MSLLRSVALTKRQPDQNIRRHYWLALKRDLFGDVCVVREWGRIGGRSVQSKQDVFASEEEAMKLFERMKRRKLKKGYCVVETQCARPD